MTQAPNLHSPVRASRFATLAARCPGTAAESLPLVMWRDVVNRDSPFIIHQHDDFLSLYLARQGQGIHVIDGVEYGVARGDVYAMGQGMAHYFLRGENLILDTLHFSPQIFDAATLDALAETQGFLSFFVEEPLTRTNGDEGGRWLHLTPDAYSQIEAEITELRAEWNSPSPASALLAKGLFLRLLVHLARLYAAGDTPASRSAVAGSRPHEATVAAAVRCLDERFAGPVRIEQVAASVFLSPDRFTEVFFGVMGRTPRDYLRHLRMERAKTLLSTSDASISDIAGQSGFGEPAYFTRAFRAAVGLTPSEFRRVSQNKAVFARNADAPAKQGKPESLF